MSAEAGSSNAAQLSSSSFDVYNADLQSTALKATKLAVALPADICFNRTVDDEFAEAIDSCSERTLRITNAILEFSMTGNASPSRLKGKRKLEDQEDVVDTFGSLVVDVLDQLFERVDMSLDGYLGRSKTVAIPVKPAMSTSASRTPNARNGRLDPSILHAAHLPKPQLKFKRKVDNSNVNTWYPKLKHKYNAQVPFGFTLDDSTYAHEASDLNNSTPQLSHPYFYEIKHISYPWHMFEHKEPISPAPLEHTPLTWVDTRDGLDLLLDKLRHAKEIAVDLEYHSYRSFSGFLCLMQISIRGGDFILDTLALREELEDLNEAFTDPKIVKVFHGADSDIVWLQQDFHLYVVNLFDTYHASKLLDFPRHGLSALLEMYCDFIPDKRYQLADWRIRPLPEEMLKYARADTHFLLYVYDNLRNALLDRGRGQPDLIHTVLKRSEETALRLYEPEVYNFENGNGPGGWNTLATKWGRALSGIPLAVFRAVHAWRDSVARMEDESTRYVLPNHYLFQLAEKPPADMTALFAVFRPVPPLVRTKAASLLEVIRVAIRKTPLAAETERESAGNGRAQTAAYDAHEHISRWEKLHEASVPSKSTATSVEKVFSDLWTSRSVGLKAVSSSLLDSQSRAVPEVADCSCARSSLFPAGWMPTKSASAAIDTTPTRYQEAVSRIHSSLLVAPIIPEVSIVAENGYAESATATTEIVTAVAVSEQIEIPFVPANQRESHSLTTKVETTDSIITVGRTKETKRKRSRPQDNTGKTYEGVTAKKSRGDAENRDGAHEAVEAKAEEFDYDSVPNFLDEPIKEQPIPLKPQKGKASKGRVFEYGNFPAPPRAYSEVQGANMSHTFNR